MATELQIKVTIAKLIQLSYEADKGLTAKIVYSGSHYSISVDQSGDVKLSGTVGYVTFNGDPALRGLGLKVKRASISFTNGDGGNVNYNASFDFAIGSAHP